MPQSGASLVRSEMSPSSQSPFLSSRPTVLTPKSGGDESIVSKEVSGRPSKDSPRLAPPSWCSLGRYANPETARNAAVVLTESVGAALSRGCASWFGWPLAVAFSALTKAGPSSPLSTVFAPAVARSCNALGRSASNGSTDSQCELTSCFRSGTLHP